MRHTKQECMEYIIVLLDDMKSEVKKIMHKDNYHTYDSTIPDLDYLHEALLRLDEEIETLEDMFENCIPEETKRLNNLVSENEALKMSISVFRDRIKILEDKLSFSLTIKDDI